MGLVLSRKIGEKILIGKDIEVTVADIVGGQVKIAIKAPREIPVHREEVAERIKRERYWDDN